MIQAISGYKLNNSCPSGNCSQPQRNVMSVNSTPSCDKVTLSKQKNKQPSFGITGEDVLNLIKVGLIYGTCALVAVGMCFLI